MTESRAQTPAKVQTDEYAEVLELLERRRNVILQGAPGTGKTYAVPEIVTRLCGVHPESGKREEVIETWKKLLEEGRAAMLTFHPSLDYEDFVEGWRPAASSGGEANDGKTSSIELADGIFKRLCHQAAVGTEKEEAVQKVSSDLGQVPASDAQKTVRIRKDAQIWQATLKHCENIREYCFTNNRICFGWEYGESLKEGRDRNAELGGKLEGWRWFRQLWEEMHRGDIVVAYVTMYSTDAIGIVRDDEPEYLPEDEALDYKLSRKVEWFWVDKDNPVKIGKYTSGKNMSPGPALCRSKSFNLEGICDLLSDQGVNVELADALPEPSPAVSTEPAPDAVPDAAHKPYVLVIDEINRGNVSKTHK